MFSFFKSKSLNKEIMELLLKEDPAILFCNLDLSLQKKINNIPRNWLKTQLAITRLSFDSDESKKRKSKHNCSYGCSQGCPCIWNPQTQQFEYTPKNFNFDDFSLMYPTNTPVAEIILDLKYMHDHYKYEF